MVSWRHQLIPGFLCEKKIRTPLVKTTYVRPSVRPAVFLFAHLEPNTLTMAR